MLTGVRGCEDGWEALGKNCEKNSGKEQGEIKQRKKPGKNTGKNKEV